MEYRLKYMQVQRATAIIMDYVKCWYCNSCMCKYPRNVHNGHMLNGSTSHRYCTAPNPPAHLYCGHVVKW